MSYPQGLFVRRSLVALVALIALQGAVAPGSEADASAGSKKVRSPASTRPPSASTVHSSASTIRAVTPRALFTHNSTSSEGSVAPTDSDVQEARPENMCAEARAAALKQMIEEAEIEEAEAAANEEARAATYEFEEEQAPEADATEAILALSMINYNVDQLRLQLEEGDAAGQAEQVTPVGRCVPRRTLPPRSSRVNRLTPIAVTAYERGRASASAGASASSPGSNSRASSSRARADSERNPDIDSMVERAIQAGGMRGFLAGGRARILLRGSTPFEAVFPGSKKRPREDSEAEEAPVSRVETRKKEKASSIK